MSKENILALYAVPTAAICVVLLVGFVQFVAHRVTAFLLEIIELATRENGNE